MAYLGRTTGVRARVVVALIAMQGLISVGRGQENAAVVPPQTLEAALRTMSDAAGVIFTGQVVAVRRMVGVVEVEFRVDRAIRGYSAAGGTYVLREWAGLWSGGDTRYRVGQRLLMMLRAPGAGGMSAPVGGMDGAIPIRGIESAIGAGADVSGNGRATANGASRKSGMEPRISEGNTTEAVPVAAPVAVADLRWVRTRAVRAVPAAPSLGTRSVDSGTVGAATERDVNRDVSIAVAGVSIDALMGMLSTWEAARGAR